MVDEESVTEAVATYLQDPTSSPARLIEMAEKFDMREPFDLLIKSSQKAPGKRRI
ncbi:hypothetical protein [Roseivivax sp. CAU 1761]